MDSNQANDITFLAKTNFRNKEVPFGIKLDDRRRHVYVVGKTGVGKTTLLENMVIQDIQKGKGVCFIDPNGDSVVKMLNHIPAHRINDIIYFNPADLEYPIAFNILETVDTKYKHLVASGMMGVFTKIWANTWSSRMEYILNNTILALLDSPGNTMLGVVRMYVDKKYRKKIIDNIKDPIVRAFWIDEFANYNEKYRTEAVAPIQNKVGQFLSSAIIRNIVGQPKSTLDLRSVMDNGKVLLIDLAKGRVGEDNAALLGAMIITKLQLAAFSRADVLEEDRKDYFLYVDEFQNFVTDSFATILSEARKYRLGLTISHQYVGQLTPEKGNTKVRDAVFGNVGTMISFRVGAEDAEFLEREFEPTFMANDLINLPKANVILKLSIDGVARSPFSATTLPPITESFTGNADKVIKVSRERYGNPVLDVEDRISRWMGAEFHEGTAALALGTQKAEELEDATQPRVKPLLTLGAEDADIPPPLPPVPKPRQQLADTDMISSAPEQLTPTTAPRAQSFVNSEKQESSQVPMQPHSQTTVFVPTSKPRLEQKLVGQNFSQSPYKTSQTQASSGFNRNKDQNGSRDRRLQRGPRQQSQVSRDFKRDETPRFQPRQKKKPETKKQNPIWDTVASLNQEKNNSDVEKVFEQHTSPDNKTVIKPDEVHKLQ